MPLWSLDITLKGGGHKDAELSDRLRRVISDLLGGDVHYLHVGPHNGDLRMRVVVEAPTHDAALSRCQALRDDLRPELPSDTPVALGIARWSDPS